MTVDELQALHNELWAFREEMRDVWPTPGQLDSLRFAACEACESLDAWLRLKGGYARNNDKTLSVEAELADCAMMLMTALGREYVYRELRYVSLENVGSLEHIAWLVGTALWYHARTTDVMDHRDDAMRLAFVALHNIAAYPGMDMPTELRKRMERIRAKHGPQSTGH